VRRDGERATVAASIDYYKKIRHDDVAVECAGVATPCYGRAHLILSVPSLDNRTTETYLFLRWFTVFGQRQGNYLQCFFDRYRLCPLAANTSFAIVSADSILNHSYMVADFDSYAASDYLRHDMILGD
jgi:hypothetical protein